MKFSSYTIGGRPANWSLIPSHMHDCVRDYIERGECSDEFLEAFLTNNLKEACQYADMKNRTALYEYCSFFYMYAPAECWGSKEKYQAWIKQGGLEGKT